MMKQPLQPTPSRLIRIAIGQIVHDALERYSQQKR
jgi:hypothetical protein